MDDRIYNNTNVNNDFEIFDIYNKQKHSDMAEINALREIMKAFRMTLECFSHEPQNK